MDSEWTTVKAKFKGTCYGCGEEIVLGDEIVPFGNGEAYHQDCAPQNGPRPVGKRLVRDDDEATNG